MSSSDQFPAKLRQLIGRVGGFDAAAAICGVTTRSLRLWLAGQGNPNACSRAGALFLLRTAKPAKRKATP